MWQKQYSTLYVYPTVRFTYKSYIIQANGFGWVVLRWLVASVEFVGIVSIKRRVPFAKCVATVATVRVEGLEPVTAALRTKSGKL